MTEPRTVWVNSYPYDYDDNLVTVAYATEQLALAAGVDDPKPCVVVEELPEPWRWIQRRVVLTNGQLDEPNEWRNGDVERFLCEPTKAWIGTHVTNESRPPHRRWVSVECWLPDTPANRQRWGDLVTRVVANHESTVTHYDKWHEDPPDANRLDKYAVIPSPSDDD